METGLKLISTDYILKILYIHQYFKTPEEGGAIRSYYLAKGLVEEGFEVEMITSHKGPGYEESTIEGIKVHYLPVPYDNSFKFVKRIFAFVKFYWLAVKKAKSIKNINLVYATSTPLTVGMIALRLKKILDLPYYFEVRDLWPEAPIQMGIIKNKFLKRWLFRTEKKIYEGADKIIALSPGIRDNIIKIVPQKPIFIIPNMSDCQFFNFSLNNKKLKENIGLNKEIIIGYFGAIGKANKLEFFLDLIMALNKTSDDFGFLIVGKGGALAHIKTEAKLRGIKNLKFLPFRNKDGVKEILSVMDAVYISFDHKKVLETNSPNKFFDAIAAGKMIITNTDGWIRENCENHHCGIYVNPVEDQLNTSKLSEVITDKNVLLTYQKNARKLAIQYYSRKMQVLKLVGVLNNEHHLKINEDSVYILTA